MRFIYFLSFLLIRSVKANHDYSSHDINLDDNKIKQDDNSDTKNYITCRNYGPLYQLNKDNYIITCDDDFYTMQYTDIFEKYFNCTYRYVQFTLSQPTDNLDSKIKDIIMTLASKKKYDAFFINFPDPDTVLKYGDYFEHEKVDLWMQITEYPKNCLWDYEFDYFDKWGDIVSKTKWHFSCRDNIAYLHYNSADKPIEGKIVFLSTTTTVLIICGILFLVICLIISFCFVAQCRYRKLTNLD